MKGLAIKIASGVLVVALVVVVALAISGVFGTVPNTDNDFVANAQASVENTQVFNGIQPNEVFYITSTKSISDIGSYVVVKDSEGNNVELAVADAKDADGNIGFLPKSGAWLGGIAYKINLRSSSVAFANEKYVGMDELIFVVDAEDVIDCELNENVVFLSKGDFRIHAIDENSWTLEIMNLDSAYSDNTVFVYQANIGEEGVKIENSDEVVTSVSYKIDPNSVVGYDANTRTMVATVVSADVDDVYSSLNVHQKNISIEEETFSINEEATINSIVASDWYLSTVRYLYGEELASKEKDLGKFGKFKIDYEFHKEKPVYATVDMTITFKGFLKSAEDASVTIKLSNKLTPNAKINFQKDPKAFDLAIDAKLVTTLAVDGGFGYKFDNTDPNNNTDANVALKNIVNNVCELVKNCLDTTNETDKPFIFATWVIPVGTTPIQIVENMGIEVKSDFKAKLSASAENVVTAQFGVAYVDDKITPYFNINNEFKFNGLNLTGVWENKVGLYNEIGITACGIISVNLGVSFGVYLDLAGRLAMDGWTIMNESLNIVPAYYVELGLYSTMNVNGKIWKFNIKQQTFLDKKWPLWDTGYKYVPVTVSETDTEHQFADETVHLNSSYFYLTKFSTYAIDIQHPDKDGAMYDINWDEFDYEYDSSLLNMRENKVKVSATAPAEFETVIKVTSKCNKEVSKEIRVIKSANQPTADSIEASYKKGIDSLLTYIVRLNSSKFIGVSLDDVVLREGIDFTYDDEVLKLFPAILETLSYGEHEVLFESSKGYLRLKLYVVSDKDIVPDNGFDVPVFDKAVPQTLSIRMPLYGNEITSVSLDKDVWSYSNASESLRISANFLLKSEGEVITVVFSNGERATITIEVVDNRSATLRTTVYDYNLNSRASLPLDVELYNKKIDKIYLGTKDVTDKLNGNVLSSEAFDGVLQGKINGRFVIENQTYNFTVNVGANNMLIVNSKVATFDKADAKDVVFAADVPEGKKLIAKINGKTCESFAYTSSALIISKEYFNSADNGQYVFTVEGADNEVVLTVNVLNTTAPTVESTVASVSKAETETKTFKWNLYDTSLDSIHVVGLDDGLYTINAYGITLNVKDMPYGKSSFTVYTEVNSFDFEISVNGEMRWTPASYNFDLTENKELQFKVDMAEKTFSEIIISKDGEEIELMNTQIRYNDGVITISNDYAYNLAVGRYDLVLRATDGETKDGAVLNVKGELPTFNSVSTSNGTQSAPYMIYTKAQFLSIAKNVNKLLAGKDFEGVYFRLGADIDLNYEEIEPIGTEKTPFKGEFDGNGYTIENLKIKDVNDGYTGLFAYNEGTIQNLRIVNISIDIAKHGSVGIGLVAGYNKGTIKNVTVVGGVIKAVSKSWKDVMNAYFDIGGVVGYNESGLLSRVKAEVEINAEVKGLKVVGITIGGRKSYINVGAIVGYFVDGKAQRCSVSATIVANSHNDSVTMNGWYGNYSGESIEKIEEAMGRCNVCIK